MVSLEWRFLTLVMRVSISILILLLSAVACWATDVWRSPESLLKEADLIAVVTIGPIHECVTPEGILVRSASAQVENAVFWRFASDKPLPAEIVIYGVDPNNQASIRYSMLEKYDKGRCFVVLKMDGDLKFSPFCLLSVQGLGKDEHIPSKPLETINWPVETGQNKRLERVPVQRAIDELKHLIQKTD